ncbi:hypothetical protein PSI23_11055 [Xenorhabdus sp. XENO-10]|uniref:Uncharacterized protein n=1 Tax=Xenorhabdus yunnanensis TaxID=3025878 RepID=A0ABT5LFE1_9GAMM|nr:hypothetical protein [Xenorhabdus yunnanensis]MDC9589821.1 hypothetical protein [Xenorhabdus yunnanensis]
MANTTPIAPYISPHDQTLFDQAKTMGFVYDPKRPYFENKGYAQYMIGQSQLSDNHRPFKDSLLGQGLTALGNALQRNGLTDTVVGDSPPSSADTQELSRLLDPIIQEHGIPPTSPTVTREPPVLPGINTPLATAQESPQIVPQREYPGINTPLPRKEGTEPARQPSADHMAEALGIRAPTKVAYNPTTNYGGHPVYMTENGIYGVPKNSIGGLESYAHLMGTTPAQLVQQEDLLKARGMQESPYWQQRYGETLGKTQNPYLARADANLAATEASKNAYGVFDRVLADPTVKASVLGNNQINGQLYLDPNVGMVNHGLLSTTPQAYGYGTDGSTLIRLPNGSVVAAKISPNMPPMLTAASIGADAAYKQDMTYTQQMAHLDALMAKTAGNPALANDPLHQLKIMKWLTDINKAQLELNRGGKSQSIKLPQVPFEQLPSEMQQQLLEKIQSDYGLGGNDPNKAGLG